MAAELRDDTLSDDERDEISAAVQSLAQGGLYSLAANMTSPERALEILRERPGTLAAFYAIQGVLGELIGEIVPEDVVRSERLQDDFRILGLTGILIGLHIQERIPTIAESLWMTLTSPETLDRSGVPLTEADRMTGRRTSVQRRADIVARFYREAEALDRALLVASATPSAEPPEDAVPFDFSAFTAPVGNPDETGRPVHLFEGLLRVVAQVAGDILTGTGFNPIQLAFGMFGLGAVAGTRLPRLADDLWDVDVIGDEKMREGARRQRDRYVDRIAAAYRDGVAGMEARRGEAG